MINFDQLMLRLPAQAANSIIGMLRLKSKTLRKHLSSTWGSPAGTPGSLVAEPCLEGAFPWKPWEGGWNSLDHGLLEPQTINLLKSVAHPPYEHQVEAWRRLTAETPASVIVSSGTGSGKTECFLVPILNSLLKQSSKCSGQLLGVRAVMLYPLNALISSQEDRLRQWFAPLNGRLRYCLYNGETPETIRAADREATPWRVADRATLRASAPPVLVTNATMLEYMLIRQVDRPILEASQGTLEFIVLDEAHSYMGAQAAEIALLLRRVALAFGRRPEQLRYVATSATIAGESARKELQEFLHKLSGAPKDAIYVVEGQRAPLPPEPREYDDRKIETDLLMSVGPLESGERLSRSLDLRRIREELRTGRVFSWAEWSDRSKHITNGADDPTTLLVQAARARDPNAEKSMASGGADSVLPSRVHLFHRTVSGLWVCINPSCVGKPTHQSETDWPYGAIFFDAREHCTHCSSIVLEWVCCTLCGEGAIRVEEHDQGASIGVWSETNSEDGFDQTLEREDPIEAQDSDEEEEVDQDLVTLVSRRYMMRPVKQGLSHMHVALNTGMLGKESGTEVEFSFSQNIASCPHCNDSPKRIDPNRGAMRPVVAGAPFLMSQITPGLLADLSPDSTTDEPLPFEGRRLITFTDARQGTARHAANIQIAAERGFVRSFVYHFVQEKNPADSAELEKVDDEIAKLRKHPELASMLADRENYRSQILQGRAKPWRELVKRLAKDNTVNHFLRQLWTTTNRDGRFDDPEVLAEFLLYREAMRRPVRANSAETLGLFRFEIPGIDNGQPSAPISASTLGMSAKDWGDLLRLLITHFVRANVAVDFDRWWLNWIDRRQSHIEMIPWQADAQTSRYVRVWPNPYGRRPTRVVRLIFQALKLDADNAHDRAKVSDLLRDAWSALKQFMTPSQNGFRFRLGDLLVNRVEKAYWCPTTRRVIDTTLLGLSPYDLVGVNPVATPIVLPTLSFPWRRNAEGVRVSEEEVDAWLATDAVISSLRGGGQWGDQNDRAAKFFPWIRAAEHSAQQSSFVLRRYEREFKEGKINVLGCSTTMEMGVDIGSVEAVLNTNVPPEIANYRQRIGRAGRQRQPIAVGLTLCKDRPLDRMAIADPREYLRRSVKTPMVSLESPTIARRHAAAFLLAHFLSEVGTQLYKLTNSAFFALDSEGQIDQETAPANAFVAWLDSVLRNPSLVISLSTLLEGTPIAANHDLMEDLRDRMLRIASDIRNEWGALSTAPDTEELVESERAAINKARILQRRRLERGYLLSELAGRAFLPSYGFPTDVVQFVTETADEKQEKRKRREEKEHEEPSDQGYARGYPSRSREVGIFEYAPGRSIVVDGIVRKSAGLTMNWQRPASENGLREVQSLRTMWQCKSCGALYSKPSAISQDTCLECGSENLSARRFLSPGGFAVDVRYKVHDDPTEIDGGETFDPWVSVRDAHWRSLPDPKVGRLRASADGLVFWFNPGEHHRGYAICLHCGRAEAELDIAGGSPLSLHRPLRGAPLAADEHTCTGAPELAPYAVVRNMMLGHEIRTDLCEIQIYDCRSSEMALTIALALREAVARRLGVDADEMGFAAPEATNSHESKNFSSVIFDRASGGAGFAATVSTDPVELLDEARTFLDCSMPGRCGDANAKKVCPRCVLGPDAQHVVENTDRYGAFNLLSNALARLSLPMEHRLFGPSTNYEPNSLPESITEKMTADPNSGLVVSLIGDPSGWDFDSWPMSTVIERWGGRGRSVTLRVDRALLQAADSVTKRRIALWVQHSRASLRALDESDEDFLVAVTAKDGATAWRSSDHSAYGINASWATTSSAPVVVGRVNKISETSSRIDIDSIIEESVKEIIFDVSAELNGPVDGFGRRFKALLVSRSDALKDVLSEPCTEVRYCDRYLFSPLVARLVKELIVGFADENTDITVDTLAERRDNRKPTVKRTINADWPDNYYRNAVLQSLLESVSPSAKLGLHRNVPHRRRFDFKTRKGSGTIFFDQGVGSWSTKGVVAFDPLAKIEDQIKAVEAMFAIENGSSGTFFACRLDS